MMRLEIDFDIKTDKSDTKWDKAGVRDRLTAIDWRFLLIVNVMIGPDVELIESREEARTERRFSGEHAR